MFARVARTILTAIAVTALTGTALAAAPAAADSSTRGVPTGEFTAVSQVTGNYMIPRRHQGKPGHLPSGLSQPRPQGLEDHLALRPGRHLRRAAGLSAAKLRRGMRHQRER